MRTVEFEPEQDGS